MVPADELLDLPCKCSRAQVEDLSLVKNVLQSSPEGECQALELPQELKLLLCQWTVGALVVAVAIAAHSVVAAAPAQLNRS